MTTTAQTLSPNTVSAWRSPVSILLLSVLLLVPCFWQSRIQAGDLSSHIYNAWLASLVAQGKVQGLWIASRSNNVLFDLGLAWLLPRVGAGAAQRIAVSVTVLIFAWGAIAFITAVAGRNDWFVVPSVAILTYGFTYHMGFFNFQLSLGICLCYLAMFWTGSWQVRLLLMPLLALAWLAHPFPVIWALGTAAYRVAKANIPARLQWTPFALGLSTIVSAWYVLVHRYPCAWWPWQAFSVTGANQILVFDIKYVYVLVAFLLVWLTLLGNLFKKRGITSVMRDTVFQLWLLNAVAVLMTPSRIIFPIYEAPFSFIIDRLSLFAGIMLGAAIAAMPMRVHERVLLLAAMITFFCCMFVDTQRLNRKEDQVSAAVHHLPAGARTMSFFPPPRARVNGLLHIVDRDCIGHCFSYADYEPSSGQFRIRAGRGNGVVLSEYHNIALVEDGKYVVQSRDLPLYEVYPCARQRQDVCSRPLQVGEVNGDLADKAPDKKNDLHGP